MRTLVLQSCPALEREGWLASCLTSVEQWARQQGFAYRWIGDELFDALPPDLIALAQSRPVIASDLARLCWMQALLLQDWQRVVWLDADVLVFAPDKLQLPEASCAVGRELWVQVDGQRWKVWKKVHNAALLAQADDGGRSSFLDFYADSAARLLRAQQGGLPDQFIGPKLLSALHNVVQFPVLESIGMLSPAVAEDLLQLGSEGAMAAMLNRSVAPLYAANLCRSSVHRGELSAAQMAQLIERLQDGCSAGLQP